MDHIFIDEAQDLPKTALTVLINAAQKTCTVGADLGQKFIRLHSLGTKLD